MNFEVIDQQKLNNALNLTGEEKLIFVSVKPKDLVKMM